MAKWAQEEVETSYSLLNNNNLQPKVYKLFGIQYCLVRSVNRVPKQRYFRLSVAVIIQLQAVRK
jgi:hypothetical protein